MLLPITLLPSIFKKILLGNPIYPKAIHHFEKAAQLGHVASLVELARIYEGEEDEEKAAEYFTQAAERRHPTAQVTLGLWETEGRVGPVPNLHKAFHWFSLAADQGKAKGFAYLGQMYLDGEGVEKNTEKGMELIQSAAAKNKPGVLYELFLYFQQRGGNGDIERSVIYLRGAVERGHAEGALVLGLLHLKGTGVEQSNKKASEFLMRSASQGNDQAQFHVGEWYDSGIALPSDAAKAVQYWLTAAQNGNEAATERLESLAD